MSIIQRKKERQVKKEKDLETNKSLTGKWYQEQKIEPIHHKKFHTLKYTTAPLAHATQQCSSPNHIPMSF